MFCCCWHVVLDSKLSQESRRELRKWLTRVRHLVHLLAMNKQWVCVCSVCTGPAEVWGHSLATPIQCYPCCYHGNPASYETGYYSTTGKHVFTCCYVTYTYMEDSLSHCLQLDYVVGFITGGTGQAISCYFPPFMLLLGDFHLNRFQDVRYASYPCVMAWFPS